MSSDDNIVATHYRPDIEITCAFCHGAGTDPFGVMSDRSVCGACGGRGHGQRAGTARALCLL